MSGTWENLPMYQKLCLIDYSEGGNYTNIMLKGSKEV